MTPEPVPGAQQKRSPSAVVPAAVAAGLAVVVMVLGTALTEVIDRESTTFGSAHQNPFFVWVLEGFAPLGQTGIVHDGSGWYDWSAFGWLLGLVVLGGLTFAVTWLGARASTSAVTVLFSTWLAVALAAGGAAMASGAVQVRHFAGPDLELSAMLVNLRGWLMGGYYWGMFLGLFIGLLTMLFWSVGRRRVTAYPAVGGPNSRSDSPLAPPR